MMFHPKHVLIKDEFQKRRMDHQSNNNDNNNKNNNNKFLKPLYNKIISTLQCQNIQDNT